VLAKGATPVLVTPPVRHLFSGARLTPGALHVNSIGVDLPAEMRDLAVEMAVPLIDLTATSQALVEALGPAGSAPLYLAGVDDTHFSEYGAATMADLVVQGLEQSDLDVVPYLH
jgi:lysophospholipase L1-like esterase